MKSDPIRLIAAVAGLLAVGWVGLRVTTGATPAPPDIDLSLPSNVAALGNFQSMQVEAFNSSEGFGFSRVAEPRMNLGAVLSVPLQLRNATQVRFAREQFALVSLLKHTPPAVYGFASDLSANHTAIVNKAKTRPATRVEQNLGIGAKAPPPTRVLDEFEVAALPRLQAGEQVVAGVDQGQLRVLGAVRAQKSCIECHEGASEGSLLGAFTYALAPIKPD